MSMSMSMTMSIFMTNDKISYISPDIEVVVP